MSALLNLKAILVFSPILMLLVLGLGIALRSGVTNMTTLEGRERFAGNLYALLFRIAGYALGLVALQKLIGAPF